MHPSPAGACTRRWDGRMRPSPGARMRAPAGGACAAGTHINHHLYKLWLMHAFDILGDPVRRRILELLADGEHTSGAICAVVQREFGITQPAVSAHLRVLRESGFATARPEGARRLYAVKAEPLREAEAWLRRFWEPHLEALEFELKRRPKQ